MSKRVFIGKDGGTFKLRVAKPGHDARTAAIEDLSLHENIECMYPYEVGVRTVNAGSSVAVDLSRSYAAPPFMVIRCAQNIVPGAHTYYAGLQYGTNRLTIYNRLSIALDIKFAIFGVLPGMLVET